MLQYFFKKVLNIDYNISNALANYITMSLDPSAGVLYYFFKDMIPDLKNQYEGLENELDEILEKHDIDIVQLFKKLAIKYEICMY